MSQHSALSSTVMPNNRKTLAAGLASQRRHGRDYSENVSRNNFFLRPNESKEAFSGNSENPIW